MSFLLERGKSIAMLDYRSVSEGSAVEGHNIHRPLEVKGTPSVEQGHHLGEGFCQMPLQE